MRLILLAVLSPLLTTAASVPYFPYYPKEPLRLRPDNTFKIAAFSDQHYGENEDSFGIPQDINSTRLTNHIISTEHPDLAVLNGDLITGENTFRENSTKYLDVLVAPLAQNGIRWASTYGNHDSKYNLTREGILAEEQKYPGAYTQHGPAGTDGVSNYMVPLYGPGPQAFNFAPEQPVALLYFLDSRGGSQNDPNNNDNIPNYVTPRTAAWLAGAHAANVAAYGVLPAFLFVHIPVQAFLDLQNSKSAHVGGSHFPGLNADIPLDQEDNSATGPYTGQDKPFMRTLLGMPGLHSVYSGHDHGDSWCGLWQDSTDPHAPSLNSGAGYASNGRPFLCFGKPSGFGGYGTWNRGVRQILLTLVGKSVRVETYVRMQEGADHDQVITRVGLNRTYGVDVYPTTDGGYHPY